MEHIANGNCKVITQGQFNQALAERQVEKALDNAQPEPVRSSGSLALDSDCQSGRSLMSAAAVTGQHADASHQQEPYDLMSSMLDLLMSKYPPLEVQGASLDGLSVRSNACVDGSNSAQDGELLDSKAVKSITQGLGFSSTVWSHDLFAESTEDAISRDVAVLLSGRSNVSKESGTSGTASNPLHEESLLTSCGSRPKYTVYYYHYNHLCPYALKAGSNEIFQ
jgi:hypothetical protein